MIPSAHPLSLELTYLYGAVSDLQAQNHELALNPHHAALQATLSSQQLHSLQQEVARLREELATLYESPLPPPPAEDDRIRATESALALRRLSDKLTRTEQALASRTLEFTNTTAQLALAKREVENAYDVAVRTRGREEEALQHVREATEAQRKAEEVAKLSDKVVSEYASLVRSLTAKSQGTSLPSHSTSSSTLVDSTPGSSTTTLASDLELQKSTLSELLAQHNSHTTSLHSQIDNLTHALALAEAQKDAYSKVSEADCAQLSRIIDESERRKINENDGAGVVERYM